MRMINHFWIHMIIWSDGNFPLVVCAIVFALQFKPDKEFCITYAEDQYYIDYLETCKKFHIPQGSTHICIENYIQKNLYSSWKDGLSKMLMCIYTSVAWCLIKQRTTWTLVMKAASVQNLLSRFSSSIIIWLTNISHPNWQSFSLSPRDKGLSLLMGPTK